MYGHYIQLELSYDTFHQNHQNTYRVITREINSKLRETYTQTGYAFGPTAKATIPEVLEFVRKERVNRKVVVSSKGGNISNFEEINKLLFVDPSFLDAFDFEMTSGSKVSAFENKYSIIITKRAAAKYFQNDDPVGMQLTISGPPSPGEYTVKGVIETPPTNTHLQFDFLIPLDNYLEYGWGGAVKKADGWNGFSVITYLTLRSDADVSDVEAKLSEMLQVHNEGFEIIEEIKLQSIGDVYMHSSQLSDPGFLDSLGDMENLRLFGFISVIILLIAWVNYINLTTARSIIRKREVGVKKSFGASRQQLIFQFLLESFLCNIIGGMLAIAIAFVALPMLEKFIEKPIAFTLLSTPLFYLAFFGILIIGTMLSGLYPASVLSSFKPVSILKGRESKSISPRIRKGLLAFQFVVSLLLAMSTYLIHKQTFFMKTHENRMDLEQLIVVKGPMHGEALPAKTNQFKTAITSFSAVHSMTSSLMTPGQFWVLRYRREGSSEQESPYIRGFHVGTGFEETFDLEILEGKAFSNKMPDEKMVIINEEAVKALGFTDPLSAIDHKLEIGSRTHQIIGVVKNFAWHSAAEEDKPYVILLYEKTNQSYFVIKIDDQNLKNSLTEIEKAYANFFPNNPFTFYFADEVFDRSYDAEEKFADMFMVFTSLAIFLACFGLFALISFTINNRIKELGIRKVLGANAKQLFLLITKDYASVYFVALIISLPIIWFVAENWLNNYANRIGINIDLILLPSIIVLLIIFLTISGKILSAVRVDPARQLRDE